MFPCFIPSPSSCGCQKTICDMMHKLIYAHSCFVAKKPGFNAERARQLVLEYKIINLFTIDVLCGPVQNSSQKFIITKFKFRNNRHILLTRIIPFLAWIKLADFFFLLQITTLWCSNLRT